MRSRGNTSLRWTGRRRGFTLVEIMLVLIILSVFAGAVVTNMSAAYYSTALDSDANMLSDVIRSAQQHARAKHCICRLVIDFRRNEYYLSSAPLPGQSFSPVSGALGSTVTLSTGISFAGVRKLESDSGIDSEIHFYPDGRCDPTYIVLAASSGEERHLEIPPLFGRVRIE